MARQLRTVSNSVAKQSAGATHPDLGRNIEATLEGATLTLRIDLSERLGPSASGKTTIVATTSGNKEILGTGVTIGLNLYTRR